MSFKADIPRPFTVLGRVQIAESIRAATASSVCFFRNRPVPAPDFGKGYVAISRDGLT